jgi:hypothetical protein
MKTFSSLSKDFANLPSKIRTVAKIALFAESALLLKEFKLRSPVDSGFYRSNWRIYRDRYGTNDTIAGVVIANNTPYYAQFMEYGAEKNKAPWYYPGANKKRTGKLITRGGRVWAGGLNPGHRKTVGGAIDPIIFNNKRRQQLLAKKIADAIIKVF